MSEEGGRIVETEIVYEQSDTYNEIVWATHEIRMQTRPKIMNEEKLQHQDNTMKRFLYGLLCLLLDTGLVVCILSVIPAADMDASLRVRGIDGSVCSWCVWIALVSIVIARYWISSRRSRLAQKNSDTA